ncbi:hypothetical protein ACHAWO_011454 [Cyclotella atomus]|uniref:Uncharacterized protein n=1 Tax=Cyclotella atomus TaxID=382360 RepID=A0ABD3Q4T6_9STRA
MNYNSTYLLKSAGQAKSLICDWFQSAATGEVSKLEKYTNGSGRPLQIAQDTLTFRTEQAVKLDNSIGTRQEESHDNSAGTQAWDQNWMHNYNDIHNAKENDIPFTEFQKNWMRRQRYEQSIGDLKTNRRELLESIRFFFQMNHPYFEDRWMNVYNSVRTSKEVRFTTSEVFG